MDVLGRDNAREAYRIAADTAEGRVIGLLPEAVIASGIPLTGGRGHQTAYDWIARHAREIETTLGALRTGHGRIRPPFDRMVLEGE